ncbi:MFS transporter [Pelagicoccus enzymogenes]|uniref:MFS transporter n=1 Tax=Pelagicoccus enzymogenes TaxID=2773457 RepID=UPI00280DF4A9|nr:MFS transporter [Pelagicoccus enzymogenes]MDQ8197378.1 MFS transporter [Pelagicoccus enzymogenes]
MSSLSKLTLARACSLIQVATVGMFSIYEVTHMSDRGLSGSAIGILLAIENALLLASGPLWGWVADRFSCYRQLVSASALGLAFALYWLSQAESLADFAIYVVLRGFLFSAMASTMTALAMVNLSSSTPGRGFSAYRTFGSIGFMSGSFLFPILFSKIDHILLAGACILPLCLFFVLQLENPPRRSKEEKTVGSSPIPAAAWLFLAAHFVVSITEPGNLGFLNDYVRVLGGSTQLVGWYSALTGLMALISLPLMGRWVDARGLYWVLALGFLSQAIRPFVIASIPDPNWLWLSHACHAFGWAGREVGSLILMISLLGAQRRATAVSLIVAVRMAGTMVGSYLMGTWAEAYGYPKMFTNISLIAMASLPLLFLALKSKRTAAA